MPFLRSLWKNNKPALFASVSTGLICTALVFTLIERRFFVSSDDALVHGNVVVIQSKVRSTVEKVPVQVFQHVKKGQLLCELERDRYQIALHRAEALYRAALSQYQQAQIEFERSKKLYQSRAIPLDEYQRAKTLFESRTELVRTERANVEKAKIDLNYTQIFAPANGVIAARTAQPGLGVRSGTPLFGFVLDHERWILAKFKETDLDDIALGSEVQVRFDKTPHDQFSGRVLGISPATEGPFAAVAPDNAAGNFNKYVQRIPIRISIDTSSFDDSRLPVGISAEVKMRRS